MAERGTDREATPGSSSLASLAAAITKDVPQPSPLPGSERSGDPGPLPVEPQKVYTPAEVADLVALPADAMYAITGNERWILGAREKEILADKTAKALTLMMQIEPKWFTYFSLFAAVGSIYGTRAIAEVKDRSNKKEEVKS